MVSLLEAIRKEREKFLPKVVIQKNSQTFTTKAQGLVNVPAKEFFRDFPKPSDFLLIDKRKQKIAFEEMGITQQVQEQKQFNKVFTRDPKISTDIRKVNVKAKEFTKVGQNLQRPAQITSNSIQTIQAFLNGKKTFGDIFRSFGF